jgi:hypothetical protein
MTKEMTVSATDHTWQECQPALLTTQQQGLPEDTKARWIEAIEYVWTRTSPEDREKFHEFCCSSDRRYADTVQRISDQILARVGPA